MFPFGLKWVTLLSPFQVNSSRLYQRVCLHIFQSVANVALKCFHDELEAALVQKRVLLLWLADVEMIYIHLNELSDSGICNRTRADPSMNKNTDTYCSSSDNMQCFLMQSLRRQMCFISHMHLCYVLADCVGTTSILIMGPMFVGSFSAKLSTLISFSLAMFRKFSFRLRRAGES